MIWVDHMLRLDHYSAMKTVLNLIVGLCVLEHIKFLIILIVDVVIHLLNLHSVVLSLFLHLLALLFLFFWRVLVALVFGVDFFFLV